MKRYQITFNTEERTHRAFFNICARNKTNAQSVLRRFIDMYISQDICYFGESKPGLTSVQQPEIINFLNQSK